VLFVCLFLGIEAHQLLRLFVPDLCADGSIILK
jgi:hypothetical protein